MVLEPRSKFVPLARDHSEAQIVLLNLKQQSMLNRFESFNPFYEVKIDRHSGGASYGKVYDGDGVVTLIREGEFVCDLGADGDLTVDFVKRGLICVYDDSKSLKMVSVDVENYLGRDSEISRWLVETDTTAVLTVLVETGVVELVMVGDIIENNFSRMISEATDLRGGLDGTVKIGGHKLSFSVDKIGDEMTVGLGKSVKNGILYDFETVSCYVDYLDNLLSGTPKDFQKLADKILIN